jgi:hypothetical protein
VWISECSTNEHQIYFLNADMQQNACSLFIYLFIIKILLQSDVKG